MRPRTLMVPALGLAAYVFGRRRRSRMRPGTRDTEAARAEQFARGGSFASDPGDPIQGFDEASELQLSPLDVDAQSQGDVEAAQDLAGLESELEAEIELRSDPEIDPLADQDAAEMARVDPLPRGRRRDAGDLYGGHTPAAADRVHPDDDRAFAEGQNWIEALETSAIENGAEPERELDIIDDEDVLSAPHKSVARDIPVADHGAGGRRGL